MMKETAPVHVEVQLDGQEYRWGDTLSGLVRLSTDAALTLKTVVVSLDSHTSYGGTANLPDTNVTYSRTEIAVGLALSPNAPHTVPFTLDVPVAQGLSGIQDMGLSGYIRQRWQVQSVATFEGGNATAAAPGKATASAPGKATASAPGKATASAPLEVRPSAALDALARLVTQIIPLTLESPGSIASLATIPNLFLEDAAKLDLLYSPAKDTEAQRLARVKVHYRFQPTAESRHALAGVTLVLQQSADQVTGVLEIAPHEHSLMGVVKAAFKQDRVRHLLAFPAAPLAASLVGPPPEEIVSTLRDWFQPFQPK